jgi:hypothetical protein
VNRRRTILAGAALGIAVVGSASASGQTADPAPPGVAIELQREVDAMLAGGLPPDHPKVRMLEREVEALVDGTDAVPVPDPGMDSAESATRAANGAEATTPEEAVQLEDELDAGDEAEAGAVECEPVPRVLTAAEVAGASSCVSVPQPDGTSRYLAVEPSGQVHVVRFGDGGSVGRMPDLQLPAGTEAADVTLVPGDDGEVQVMSAGTEVATLDPG